MTTLISASRLLAPSGLVENPAVTIDDGRITAIRSHAGAKRATAENASHNFPDGILVPAYLDIHIHGAAGHDAMEGTPQALNAIGSWIASRGVGAYLPTTVTSSIEATLKALDRLAGEVEHPSSAPAAVPLGIHLEGPFLSHGKRGAHPAALLQPPSIPLFERFWEAARGQIRLMTIAPELPEALALIEHATARGVICSLGHSNATYADAQAGFDAGARTATHTFNAMRALDHRDPGLLRIFFKAKGGERAILITDSISATGMPEGEYRIGDVEVIVKNGRCILAGSSGTLAGSVLTMDRAVANFVAFTRAELPDAVTLATRNPARLLGLEDQWGALEEGREANIVVLSPPGEVVQVFRSGRPLLD
jgi:N-acetylglucosamine-6-phosphate deacetylase